MVRYPQVLDLDLVASRTGGAQLRPRGRGQAQRRLNGGHYTAFAKDCEDDQRWFSCNDQHIGAVGGEGGGEALVSGRHLCFTSGREGWESGQQAWGRGAGRAGEWVVVGGMQKMCGWFVGRGLWP